ncbi:hypothetical protein [Streptomyces monashensis]|uniref:hypothetical protein n=1 Tax=Streptomyces monashensis TaxID=1678012 RepID=UPI0015A67293|nr:hypothetical protein [Streptomyces monashensis]
MNWRRPLPGTLPPRRNRYDPDPDSVFEFGLQRLQRLLDGLASLLEENNAG